MLGLVVRGSLRHERDEVSHVGCEDCLLLSPLQHRQLRVGGQLL